MKSDITCMVATIMCFLALACGDTDGMRHKVNDAIPNGESINKNMDSVFLNLAYEFKASSINLEESFSEELKAFLLKADTVTLKQQPNFRLGVILILQQLYLYHLSCCNQGYNLIDMRGVNTRFITTSFIELAGIHLGYDKFLNSGYIYEFIQKNQTYLSDTKLASVHKEIEKQMERLNGGINK